MGGDSPTDCSGRISAKAVRRIAKVNKRRKAGGWYFPTEDLQNGLADEYDTALHRVTLEVHEGLHTSEQLATLVDRDTVLTTAREHKELTPDRRCAKSRSDP